MRGLLLSTFHFPLSTFHFRLSKCSDFPYVQRRNHDAQALCNKKNALDKQAFVMYVGTWNWLVRRMRC